MKIFEKIWTAYSLVIFALLAILYFPIFLILILLLPKKGQDVMIWLLHHTYTRFFFGLSLVHVQVAGKALLQKKQSYIIVSNHVSALDFMLNAMAFPGIYRFLAKKELLKIPLMGEIVRKICVVVDRSDAASRSSSLKNLRKYLAGGASIFIYPEGQRNKTNELLAPFHKGAFRLAIETGTPIAVQTIANIESVSERGNSLVIRPGSVKLVWSQVIETKELEMKDLNELIQQVQDIMKENMEQSKARHSWSRL